MAFATEATESTELNAANWTMQIANWRAKNTADSFFNLRFAIQIPSLPSVSSVARPASSGSVYVEEVFYRCSSDSVYRSSPRR
jgi:hypothetical protein